MSETNKAIIEKVNAAFDQNNPEVFLEYCADDIRWDMAGGEVQKGKQAIRESHSIRGEAVHYKVTYYTTLAAAKATCDAIDHIDSLGVNRLQELHAEASA